ncbi:S-layer homology domain-containing protein [Paenibacillus mendelii]|uniref:S-layer homology domain-containing protein n=1 Tax=Paenibacillus mendelii TaxID=206163 RepID=A0ABV6J3N7_9BACL|nr:S-layer homology domain-containing protein [Paenibacillus mendelii]MCQ6561956.1 S-layer homology domain-containing protein [Paenibacillus mendelii]
MNKRNKQWLVALSTAVALTAAVPAAAYADKAVPDLRAGTTEGSSAVPIKAEETAPVNTAISKEKAISLAKSYVSIPADYKIQNVSLYNRMDINTKRNVWNLSFVKTVNGKHKGSIEVSLDADNGDMIGFNTYIDDPGAKPSYPLKVNREKAQEVALSFLAKMSPRLKDQVRLNADYGADAKPPLNGQVRHSLRYDRMVGEFPFVGNYIDIEVDSEGRVLSYQVNWNADIKFEQVKPGMTMTEAMAKIRETAKPELVYVVPYQMKQPRKPVLSYELQPIVLDAVTGEVQQSAGNSSQISTAPLAEKALGTKPKNGKNLTREQAAQTVKDHFTVPAGAAQEQANYNEYTDEYSGITTAEWNIGWTLKDGDKEIGNVNASVDSRTGIIRSFNSYTWQQQAGQSMKRIAYADARTKAVELVKKQLPWLVQELYLSEPSEVEIKRMNDEQSSEYSFRFVHKVGDARIDYNNVRVSIDAYSGEVRNYYANIAEFDYPEQAPAVISRDKAVDAWLDYYKLELTYVLDSDFVWNGSPISREKYNLMVASGELQPGEGLAEPKTKLVFRLVSKPIDEPVFLDAQTGQWRNQTTGDAASLEKPQASDIEGHWAQRELELMVAYKALDVADGKVRPNQVITRGELIKMLVLSMNSGRSPILYSGAESAKSSFDDVSADSSYFVYVQNALEQNLIDRGDGSFNPEGKVDREEMAELIVRALGYNPLAERNELFNLTFKDADKTEQKGQAAIVIGLGIMSLKDGNFVPDREVTRAEAAAAFFRFLSVSADLKEAPLRND